VIDLLCTVSEFDESYRFSELVLGEIERNPHPRSIVATVGRKSNTRVQEMIGDDLHRFLLSHQYSDAATLLVPKISVARRRSYTNHRRSY
jgi:hypothetical protein